MSIWLLGPVLILIMVVAGCSTNPNFRNDTVVGILNLNGFGPGNTKVGIVHQDRRVINPLPFSQTEELWSFFQKARPIGSSPDTSGIELRLEALGAGAARMLVNSNDVVWLEIAVDSPDSPPKNSVDTFKISGLFLLLNNVETAETLIRF
jgi:hypothetical protein